MSQGVLTHNSMAESQASQSLVDSTVNTTHYRDDPEKSWLATLPYIGEYLDAGCYQYTETKKVKMRSKHLKWPQIIGGTGIALYILVWRLGCRLQHMREEPLKGLVIVNMRMPKPIGNGSCFFRQSNAQDDSCDIRELPDVDYPYCDKFPGKVKGCGYFSKDDIFPLKWSQSIFVNTVIERKTQIRRESTGGLLSEQVWETVNSTKYFVKGIEDHLLHVKLSYIGAWPPSRFEEYMGWSTGTFSNEDVQGFIELADGTRQKIPCYKPNKKDCPRLALADGVPPCGDLAANRSGCFSTDAGDYISVQTLLRMVDLDKGFDEATDLTSENSHRNRGIAFQLSVHCTNLEWRDYWTSWLSMDWSSFSHTKYVYSAKMFKYDDNTIADHRYSYDGSGANYRYENSGHGMAINVVAVGVRGHADLFEFGVSLTVFFTLMEVTKQIIRFACKWCYKNCCKVKAPMILLQFYSIEKTPTETELEKKIDEGHQVSDTLIDLETKARKRYAKTFDDE